MLRDCGTEIMNVNLPSGRYFTTSHRANGAGAGDRRLA